MSDKGVVKVVGIKCDNCDYENTSVKPHEFQSWVNKPCPKCGESVLSESDYNLYKFLTATSGIANKISPEQMELPTDTGKIYNPQSKNMK